MKTQSEFDLCFTEGKKQKSYLSFRLAGTSAVHSGSRVCVPERCCPRARLLAPGPAASPAWLPAPDRVLRASPDGRALVSVQIRALFPAAGSLGRVFPAPDLEIVNIVKGCQSASSIQRLFLSLEEGEICAESE